MGLFNVETWYKAPDKSESVALVAIKGVGKTVCNAGCSSSYQVVSGSGTFFFPELGVRQDVGPGDVVDVSSGRVYRDEGDLVIICTSRPAFDPTAVVVVE